MDMYQNSIHILLNGLDIINLIIMMNIEIRINYHMSPWATPIK